MRALGSSRWRQEALASGNKRLKEVRGQQGPEGLQCPLAASPDPDRGVPVIVCIFRLAGEAGGARMPASAESQ